MAELTKGEKRKYALALRRVDYGVWGYTKSLFRVLNLTTRAGDDNGTKRFGKDLRKLIAWFRKLGYEVEYCGVYEFTPENALLHWHGILRVKGGYFPVTRRMLGDKWNEIHNAFVVDIQPVKKMSYLEKYINKHMVKDYLSDGVIRNKFLVSRGWCRGGIGGLIADFKKWYFEVMDTTWMSTASFLLLKSIIRGYCECKETFVGNGVGKFGVFADRRIYSEIYHTK